MSWPRIAIVGYGGLLPGADDLEQFWHNLVAGADPSTEVPTNRWLIPPKEAFDPTVGKFDHVYSTRGYFLKQGPRNFDGLDIDCALISELDPSVHLALCACQQAWNSARTSHVNPTQVGVILGHIALPTESVSRMAREILEPIFMMGERSFDRKTRTHHWNRFVAGLPALLAAKALGFGLGGLALDAACASSLYAIKLAVDDLQSGRADAMLAGGLSRPDCLYTQMGFCQLRAMSLRGRCSPFDSAADGLVVGEGAGVFVLKRLTDAERDGDTIHGVINGIGLSNDREGNLLAPASEGQLRALQSAYDQAQWNPSDVDLIECHATGTPLGDAVEFRSLTQLWSREHWHPGQCALGAVKSSVGHLLTGAGAAGLLKVLLGMTHEAIPPITNFQSPSRNVELARSPFRILTTAEDWPRYSRPKRAGISAFGFGGINAHLLIEEYRPTSKAVSVPNDQLQNTVAVVGLAVRHGKATNLGEYCEHIWNSDSLTASETIAGLDVPLGRFPIPPREFEAMMPQQALMLLTAADAFEDSGLKQFPEPDRTGVYIGCGLDLHTTDFHFRWSRPSAERDDAGPPLTPERVLGHLASITASRIARTFDIGGPSYTLCSESTSGLDALRIAVQSIQRGELSAAIVGAVDTPTDVRNLVVHSDEPPVDGAVCLILEPLNQAIQAGRTIYAVVETDGANASIGSCELAGSLIDVARAIISVSSNLIPPTSGQPMKYWFTNQIDGVRQSTITQKGMDGIRRSVSIREYSDGNCNPLATNLRLDDKLRLLQSILTTITKPAKPIAFVYPGAGNHYPHLGRDLAAAFPHVLRRQETNNRRLKEQYAVNAFDRDEIQPSAVDVLIGQVSFGTLVTDILAEFGVRPQAIIGHSLGLSAGLFAMGAWTDRDEMLRRLQVSPLFRSELTGPCHAARRAWNSTDAEIFEWTCGIVSAPADSVRRTIANCTQSYLLAINSPAECVIGGKRSVVADVIEKLGAPYCPINGVIVAHCDIIEQVSKSYYELHLLPTTPPANVTFYHPVMHRHFAVTRESAADAILAQATQTVDFPAMIEAAYADGIRNFVEIGPGDSCTRMIGAILADRPHRCIAVTRSSKGEVDSLFESLASLADAGVQIDRSKFQQKVETRNHNWRTFHVPLRQLPFEVRRRTHDRSESRSHPPVRVNANPAFATAVQAQTTVAQTHEAFLRFSMATDRHMGSWWRWQSELLGRLVSEPAAPPASEFLDREQCLAFATGTIGSVLGPAFAEIDRHPTRVRLPHEPLMLVDRIIAVEGEPLSFTRGRIVTEHEVTADRWYLDHDRMPTCIAVESGQADLFLSGYLGIDLRTRGLAVYRLLDAVVTFHQELPRPDAIVRYDIHIDQFFRQGETHLFRFRFEGIVDGQPLLTMTNGCAGFFTQEELQAGQGIVQTALDRRPDPRHLAPDWLHLVPFVEIESYSDLQIQALRHGDLATCFGNHFEDLPLANPTRLPDGRMRLIHRVPHLDPRGGRFGLGFIRAEAEVRPGDWYLTCHFVDDMVMPGTLMYECCLHTLRVFLMRMGWIGEHNAVSWEPVPGVASRLKCRGQVIASTKLVTYEVSIKELGYRPEPYAMADVLMYADGKPIVEITDMSVRLMGTDREKLKTLWAKGAFDLTPPLLGGGRGG